MKDALYSSLIVVAYSTAMIVFLSSFEEMSLIMALNYNILGGVLIFSILTFIEYIRKRK